MSVVDAAAVNPNGIKTILANGLGTFCIKSNPVFSIGPKILRRNPPNCPILYIIEFLIILHQLMKHLQKFYEASKLVCYLITV